jgi:PAS domain S-box-containing protein
LRYETNRPQQDFYENIEDVVRFENLLFELSARFVSVTPGSIDGEIVDAQRRIVEELELDRSTLAQLEGGEHFVITHTWHLPGLEPFPRFAVRDLPWMSSAILRGSVVCFARVDDMPAEAIREKEVARHFGPRSNVTFPLKIGGEVIGALAFGTVHRERDWPAAMVNRLRLFAEMIGNAIARTRAERALHESENKLRSILDSTADAIYGIDLEGCCTFSNPACLRSLGYERSSDLLGKHMHNLTHRNPGGDALVSVDECRLCRAAITGAGNHLDDEMLWRSDKTSFPVEYWCYPQWSGGRIVGAVISFSEITQRKQTEEAMASMSRKFIEAQEADRARIARELHDDIGQSLAVLKIQMLRAGQPVSDRPETNHASLQDLTGKLEKIIDGVSRLSHNLHSSELELLGLATAVKAHCRESSEQFGIPIRCSCDHPQEKMDSAVALAFFRLLQEALHNAMKHSEAKSIAVRLTASDQALSLDIVDDGVGFDIEQSRLAAGLGLISMRERIHLIGGDFQIHSAPRQGTRIMARAPIVKKTL